GAAAEFDPGDRSPSRVPPDGSDGGGRADRAPGAVLPVGTPVPSRRARATALARQVALRVSGVHRPDVGLRRLPRDDANVPSERRLPFAEPRLRASEVTRRIVEGQLRAAGVARSSRFGIGFDGVRPAGGDRVLAELVREGVAVPVTIEGLRGTRYAHAEALEAKV